MQTLNADELQVLKTKKQDVVLINVLPEDQFRQGFIPGSENVPVEREDFVEQVAEKVGDKSREVVVYCASPECDASPKAAKKLEKAGFAHVYDFEGGMKQWKQAHFPYQTASFRAVPRA